MIAVLTLAVLTGLQEPRATTTIGIEGRVVVEHAGPPLRATEVRESARLVLMVGALPAAADGTPRYELRFLARRPGDYDLRNWLQFGPDQPVGEALAPILVRVDSLLPADHQGELEEIPGLSGPERGGFDRILTTALILWLLPAIGWLAWRWHRRPRPEPVVIERPPTLAELLEPLVERALRGELDLAGQARLERLLLGHWRARLGLDGVDQAAAVRRMRADAEAGELLRAIEAWLHRPDASEEEAEAVRALLARYRGVPAVAAGEDAAR